MDNLEFQHGYSRQGKLASEATNFVRVLSGLASHESTISQDGVES